MNEKIQEDLVELARGRFFGKYRGMVVDSKDPENRGRVKVKVTNMLPDEGVWATPCVPYAGDKLGFYCIPDKDAGVWIEFEGGDLSYPIWTGCFWGKDELPDGAKPHIKIWKTKSLTISINDESGELVIETSKGSKLTIVDEVRIESGEAIHTVSNSAVVSDVDGKKVEVKTSGITIEAGATGKIVASPSKVSINDTALEVQ